MEASAIALILTTVIPLGLYEKYEGIDRWKITLDEIIEKVKRFLTKAKKSRKMLKRFLRKNECSTYLKWLKWRNDEIRSIMRGEVNALHLASIFEQCIWFCCRYGYSKTQ